MQRRTNPLNDEKGMALVLAISMIALLASMGVWLAIESQGSTRLTRAFERIEETFHLAEGGCWLSVHALDKENLEVGDCATINKAMPSPAPAYLTSQQSVGFQKFVTPEIFTARDFYNTAPLEGWELNWQGASAYHREFYLIKGTGEVQMPKSKGRARSVLYNLSEKVTRNN